MENSKTYKLLRVQPAVVVIVVSSLCAMIGYGGIMWNLSVASKMPFGLTPGNSDAVDIAKKVGPMKLMERETGERYEAECPDRYMGKKCVLRVRLLPDGRLKEITIDVTDAYGSRESIKQAWRDAGKRLDAQFGESKTWGDINYSVPTVVSTWKVGNRIVVRNSLLGGFHLINFTYDPLQAAEERK